MVLALWLVHDCLEPQEADGEEELASQEGAAAGAGAGQPAFW